MLREYNEMAFDPKEVEKGLHLDLLNTLLKYNQESNECYNDIHIITDGYCTIIQWVTRDYEGNIDIGSFRFIRDDQIIMDEIYFPDGHYGYFKPNETKKCVEEWLEEHKEEFGRYYYDENCKEIIRMEWY